MNALDLFAGPGGLDEGLLELGIKPLGIEIDEAACATREKAGHRTLQADIATLDPILFAPCELLLASPPCPTFSTAGNRDGLKDMHLIEQCHMDLVHGKDTRDQLRPQFRDDRSLLVIEPLRWTLELRPKFVCWEQVPDVLPLWEAFGDTLRYAGYSVWTGILRAEQYGVPQTRKRAFLIASTEGRVFPPPPTHRRYVAPRRELEQPTLFDVGEREVIVAPGEHHLLPWVSMAQALDWGATARPYPVIASSRTTGGPDKEKVGGSGAREALYEEKESGRWQMRQSAQGKATERHLDESAPTVLSSFDNGDAKFLVNTGRDWKEGGTREDAQTFDAVEQPAPAVDGKGRWFATRPATVMQGDPRVFSPGGHIANDGRDNDRMTGRSEDAIRVSLEDAAVLQGFRRDYPFQGTKSKQFEQVGNAVPPPLARAVVKAVLAAAQPVREAYA